MNFARDLDTLGDYFFWLSFCSDRTLRHAHDGLPEAEQKRHVPTADAAHAVHAILTRSRRFFSIWFRIPSWLGLAGGTPLWTQFVGIIPPIVCINMAIRTYENKSFF